MRRKTFHPKLATKCVALVLSVLLLFYAVPTAVSPKKIAMYTTKLTNVQKEVAVSTLRTVGAGFVANVFHYIRNKRVPNRRIV